MVAERGAGASPLPLNTPLIIGMASYTRRYITVVAIRTTCTLMQCADMVMVYFIAAIGLISIQIGCTNYT